LGSAAAENSDRHLIRRFQRIPLLHRAVDPLMLHVML
jgi:hypothetical protein